MGINTNVYTKINVQHISWSFFFYFHSHQLPLFSGYYLHQEFNDVTNIFTCRRGSRFFHLLFMYLWEHSCATTSYIKCSKAKVKGLERIPQITFSVPIKSMRFSLYISSITLMQRRWKILKRKYIVIFKI